VRLTAKRVELPEGGNLQERARDARYALAERLAPGDYAAGHTASDQAETVLYRLAVSPGRRALLGMEPRRGRLVRPLLRVTRSELRDYCRARIAAFKVPQRIHFVSEAEIPRTSTGKVNKREVVELLA
jgi:tRNA(Ile)-lysidine synthase